MLKDFFSIFRLLTDAYKDYAPYTIPTTHRPTPHAVSGKKAWKNRGKVSSKKYQARR